MVEDYRIKPVVVEGQECDGVYVDERGAWIGTVTTGPDARGTIVTDVVPIKNRMGERIPAPHNWREHVVERLGVT